VYAILNDKYSRSRSSSGEEEGWESCEYVGITKNLAEHLSSHLATQEKSSVSYVRALSFAFPRKAPMEEVATRWKSAARVAGANPADRWEVLSTEDMEILHQQSSDVKTLDDKSMSNNDYLYDSDSDSDDEEFELNDILTSPFSEQTASPNDIPGNIMIAVDNEGPLSFDEETVSRVLDEIRPYLISDGGNVSVQKVDVETRDVYLVLEGACSGCPSSTVTMQMGIERVLRENFDDLGEVINVENSGPLTSMNTAVEPPKEELTLEAVQTEINRIGPAISAMGGTVEIKSIDPIGVVEIQFRGPNKLQQGLELALRDVKYVKHVKFVSS